MDGYLQQTSKLKTICPIYAKPPTALFNRYTVPFARSICTIAENENVKEKRFKGLKQTFLEQKHPKLLIEASILKAKEKPLEILGQPKTAKNEDIIRFTITFNPNDPNVFPVIKKSFVNFQYFKTMSNVF